jgi:SAM-dependent methyltransferase
MSAPAYDRIGLSYSEVRRADPHLQAAIDSALGDAKRVLNIGAGAGSYEPGDREVIAVEPSPLMIAQRPADAAPVIRGTAESLPLEDKSVDATMGVFTMQHWDDVDRGLAEVLRVTRERIVLLTLDLDVTAEMWLCRDYLPEIVGTTARSSRRSPTCKRSFPVFRSTRCSFPPAVRMASVLRSGAGPRLISTQPYAGPRRSGTCWRPPSRTADWTGCGRTSRAVSGIVATDSCGRRPRLTWGYVSFRLAFTEACTRSVCAI